MKYLIEDTEKHTLSEVHDYFKSELLKTSLNKEEILINHNLKLKLAMVEIERILDDNGMGNFYKIGLGFIHLNRTENRIRICKKEIQSRFEEYFENIVTECYELVNN